MRRLRVSGNRWFLVQADGSPFFWRGEGAAVQAWGYDPRSGAPTLLVDFPTDTPVTLTTPPQDWVLDSRTQHFPPPGSSHD